MLISFEKKLVFFHIPKTGGVSVRSLLEKYKDIDKEDYSHKLSRKIDGKSVWLIDPLHINQKQAKELYDLDGYNEFTVVREPFERIVSLYNYGNNSMLFKSFSEFMKVVEKHYLRPNSYREIYNSQLYWITSNTMILKLEDIVLDPIGEFKKIDIDITVFPKENEAVKIKYKPTDEEKAYCLNFLVEEYERLNYSKPGESC